MPNSGALNRFAHVLRREGLRVALCRTVHHVLGVTGEIEEARQVVNRHLRNLYGNRVAHGVFEGMLLRDEQWWGGGYLASKILGTYERHIARLLESLADPNGVLIDIGAADGYFAVGCLKRGFFAQAICFEISTAGRQSILENAEQNGVADAVSIHGAADREEIIGLLADIPSGVILCDIEGAEYDLFDPDLLRACRHLHVIVEMHDHIVGPDRRTALLESAGEFFAVDILRSENIETETFTELSGFRDDFRLLAFSEGRGRVGDWLLMSPK